MRPQSSRKSKEPPIPPEEEPNNNYTVTVSNVTEDGNGETSVKVSTILMPSSSGSSNEIELDEVSAKSEDKIPPMMLRPTSAFSKNASELGFKIGGSSAVQLLTPRTLTDENFLRKKNFSSMTNPSSLGLEEDDEEVQASINIASSDPFNNQLRPPFKLPRKIYFAILIIPVMCIAIILLCYGLDKISEEYTVEFRVADIARTFFNPGIAQARSSLEAICNTMSVIFGLLLTVVGIVLQTSVAKFTGQVTSLFFRDKTIVSCLAYIVFCNAFSFWVYLSINQEYAPRTSVVLVLFMMLSHLVLLFPFLAYLFYFLEPDKVIAKIMKGGLGAAIVAMSDDVLDIDRLQVKAILAVENLMSAANTALKKKDKILCATVVDALCSFSLSYGLYKGHINRFWFRIPVWIRQNPDFLTLSDEAVQQLRDAEIWMEWKILRQYQFIFVESLKKLTELCYHVAIDTRLIGQAAVTRNDLNTLDLITKFFNTYLRAAINSIDSTGVRTTYNLMFQYRQLAEFILDSAAQQTDNELELRAVKIAKFIRFYSSVLLDKKNSFLVEVAFQDLRVIVEKAFTNKSKVHDRLLDIFLTLDDGSLGMPDNSFEGTRQAQIILATFYLHNGAEQYARRIHDDFPNESFKKLWGYQQELSNISNKDFWEVTERAGNIRFISRDQKLYLPKFFSWFKNYQSDTNTQVPLNPQERRVFARKQNLLNFE